MAEAPPGAALDAVLVASEPVPEDAQQVAGIDWPSLPPESRSAVADFVLKMSQQGFQSTAIGDAIQTINEMVSVNSEAYIAQFDG